MKLLHFSRIILITIVFILFSSNCKKNETVPNVSVDFTLELNSVDYTALGSIGGWVYITGGAYNNGIIIYKRTNDEYKAYDRTCTYKPSSSCRVTVESSGIIAVDSCCGSKFILTDGSVNQKPATAPLKEYHTSLSGTTLHIYN
ncbi:MAG: hypothetical protein WC223_05640 [Bacteroidales bacterium]|jgi:nitrite reductase/ring-hydroxylating ferredoxin subunit